MAREEFDWNDENVGQDLIIPEQKATACYYSLTGSLVIRQNSRNGTDPYVAIRPEYIPALIQKLQQLLDQGYEITGHEQRSERASGVEEKQDPTEAARPRMPPVIGSSG